MTRKDVVKFLGLLLSILIATIQSPMAQTRAAQQAASSVRFHHVHAHRYGGGIEVFRRRHRCHRRSLTDNTLSLP